MTFVAPCVCAAALAAPTLNAWGGGGGAGSGEEGWKEFTSATQHFTVRYPDTWYQAQGLVDLLDVTNFRRTRSEEGIALKVGGAEVTVSAAQPDVRSVDDWMNRDVPDDASVLGGSPVKQAEVPVGNPALDGCEKIRRVTWREEIAPNAYFARSMYYCSASAGLYRIALSNWDGDPAQSRLEAVALEIALSLRTR